MRKQGRYEKAAPAKPRKSFNWSKLAQRLLVAVLCCALLAGIFWGTAPNQAKAAVSKVTVADNRTLNPNNSPNYATNTKNVGRIWTDKSVSADSIHINFGASAGATVDKTAGADFIVALSAMSSTSTLTTNVVVPLDIILVLDDSGSMDYDLSTTYEAVYASDLSTRRSYYILRNGEYQQVQYDWREESWYYGWYSQTYITPKTSAEDSTANSYQFYNEVTTSRTDALKEAATHFIDATAEINGNAASVTEKHKIGVVTFADNASDRVVLSEDMDAVLSSLDRLTGSGATNAAAGMQNAQEMLDTYGREGAQQVIIFFTDGVPTTQSSFSGTVAYGAVDAARTLKNNGAIIYSVAVYEDADAQDTTTDINKFLHAVSSNYNPTGTSWNNLQLGERVTDSDYYKVATDAIQLNTIFDDIFKEVSSPILAPTHVSTDAPNGYVTFRDELGAFMEVKDFNGVYINGVDYTSGWTKSVDGNGVITYTSNTVIPDGVNDAYPEDQNLSSLKITVTPGSGTNGDLVTVEVPAVLLPLRKYDVDANGNLTIDNAQPFRAFYSVGLRNGVEDALLSGQLDAVEGLRQYVQTHTFDGRTHFYANDWNYVVPDATGSNLPVLGGTTVTFTPARTNSFYFYVEDTPLYVKSGDTYTRLKTAPQDGQEVYYQYQHYALEGDTSVQLDGWVPVIYAASANSTQIAQDAEGYYIKAGTPKIKVSNAVGFWVEKPDNTNLDSHAGAHAQANITQTATYALVPTWAGGNSVNYLGNNGRVSYIATGSLNISKTVTAAEGLTAPDKEFTVKVQLANTELDVAGEYTTTTYTAGGSSEGVPGTVTIDSNGVGTLKLRKDQTVTIHGLYEGTTYTLTETDLPAGFAQTDAVGTQVSGEEGIKAGTVNTASFTNHYSVAPVTGGTHFPVRKIVTDPNGKVMSWEGKDWSFRFRINTQQENDQIPMPERTEITIDSQDLGTQGICFGFEDVRFTQPGTYLYVITEIEDTGSTERLPGINYSRAVYRLEVVVTDNGDGTLTAASNLYWITKDDSTAVAEATKVESATFTNIYDLANVVTGPDARKVYTDHSGGRPLTAGAFQFAIRAVGENAAAAPQVGNGTAANTLGGVIDFGTATFTQEHVGQTFTYEISEVIPENKIPGMTYDTTVYVATVEVLAKSVDAANDTVAVHTTYTNKSTGEVVEANQLVFANSYDPEDVTVELFAQKTLAGRDWMAADSFRFTLTGYAAERILPPMPASHELTVSADSEGTGAIRTGAFGSITYDTVGVYTYHVTENAGTLGGVTYDNHTATITVTVSDPGTGKLQAQVAYDNAAALTEQDQAVTGNAAFTNTYKAQEVLMTPAAIKVTKELTGRQWQSFDEYTFVLIPSVDGMPMPSTNTITFRAAAAGTDIYFDDVNQLTFTQAGTYTYYILERTGTLGGITYDRSVFKLDVVVSDPGTGKLVVSSRTFSKAAAPEGLNLNTATAAQLADLAYTQQPGAEVAKFHNSYRANEVIMTPSQIHGYKQLIGRDMKADEQFTFSLSLTSSTVTASDADPTGVMIKDPAGALTPMALGGKIETVVANMAEGTASFDFGNITFTQVGTYTFAMGENAAEEPDPLMSYDSHGCTVTVVVTDNGRGQLVAAVSYGAQGYAAQDANRFVNHYYDPDEAKTVTGAEDPTVSVDGQTVSAGQVLTYGIHWENTTSQEASVTITDTIPAYTTLVDGSISAGGVLSDDGRTITWELTNIPAHGQVDVSFQVKVDTNVAAGADITNQAQLSSGNQTNITHSYLPGKSVENTTAIQDSESRSTVHVGDILTYTVRYWHPGNGKSVQIRDILHGALSYVAGSASDGGTIQGNVLSWVVASEAGDAAGWKTVTFQAKVTQAALSMTDKLTNQATIDNQHTTNVIGVDLPKVSTLTITKTVTTDISGITIPAPAGGYFIFQVELYEPDGKTPLTDTYYYTGAASGSQQNSIQHRGVVTIAPGGSVTISGLPVGTVYKVTEVVQSATGYVPGAPVGFTQTAPAGAVPAAGSVAANGSTAAFVNKFTPAVMNNLVINKQVQGANDWHSNWSFDFNLSPVNDAPMPAGDGKRVTIGYGDTDKSGAFGTIYYTAPGTYQYTITEDRTTNIAGITKSYAAYRVLVTVKSDANGVLVIDSVQYEKFVDDDQTSVEAPIRYTVGSANDPGILFTNLYRLTADNWTPTVVKSYTNSADPNAAMPAFQFQIQALRAYKTADKTPVSSSIPSFASNGDTVKTVTNDAAGYMSFGLVEFNHQHEGNTYEYLISEVIPVGKIPGMTYDANKYIARVTVTSEQVEGTQERAVKLTVSYHKATQDTAGSWVVDESDTQERTRVIFSNAYTPQAETVELQVRKELTGRGWLEFESFGFTLLNLSEGAPMPEHSVEVIAGINAQKSIWVTDDSVNGFGAMSFDKVGDYFYQIVEVIPAEKLGGLTYDEHSHYVWVKITDNGMGELEADVKYFATSAAMEQQYAAAAGEDFSDQDAGVRRNHALFVNRYEHGTVTLPEMNLTVNKTLEGRQWRTADKFYFTITGSAGAPLPETTRLEINSANHTGATFGGITFTEPGTYTYTIAEEIPGNGLPGVKYDASKYIVTVVVTDNGDSTLSITGLTYGKADSQTDVPDAALGAVSNISFTNTYVPEDAVTGLNVEKVLNGRLWQEGDSFTFTLTARDNAPMPADAVNGTKTVTVTTASVNHVESFGAITYDRVGTYRYTVTEAKGDLERVTYDAHTAVVTVEVYDDPDTGKLKTTVTYDGAAAAAAKFVNVYYVADKDVFVGGTGTSIDGQMVSAGQVLTYTIDWANTSGQIADVVIRDRIPAVTTIVRDSTAVSGFSGAVERSYVNGEMVWRLKDVPIGASGTLTFQVQVTATDRDGAELANQATITVGFNEHTTDVVTNYLPGKSVDKTTSKLGEEMEYTITYYHPGNGATVQISDALHGNLTFVLAENGGVYTEADHTVRWSITSNAGDAAAWKTVSFTAKLNVGALDEKTVNQAIVNGVKTNVVELPKIETKSLSIAKTVELISGQGTTVNADLLFTFQVKLTDAGNAPLPGTYAWAIDGQIQSDKIGNGSTITLKHGQKATVFELPAGTKYTVTETNIPAGYAPVANNKSGSVDTPAQQNVEFTNTYSVEALAEAVFHANKVLNGPEGTSLAGKTFQIGVYTTADCVNTSMVAQGAANGSSNAQGEITFGAITFTSAGSHTFYLKEINAGAENIKYDATVYRAVVTVVDNKDGTLRVSGVTYTKLDGSTVEKPVFTNEFVPGYTDVTVNIVADKELAGWNDLAHWEGKFTFGLFDQDNNLVATGTNGPDGKIRFENVVAAVFALMEEPAPEFPGTYPIDVVVTDGPAAFVRLNDTALPLTDEELALVKAGEVLSLKVLVENTAVEAADQALIGAAAPEATVLQYLNISLTKSVAGVESPVTQTSEMVKMTLAVEAVEGRVYQLVRLHNGAAQILEDLDGDGNATVTVLTDQFSTYALVYTDTPVPEQTAPETTAPEAADPADTVQQTPAPTAPEAPQSRTAAAEAPLTANEFRRTRDIQVEPEFTFGTQTSGEFTFILREQKGDLPGVTYDETEYVVKIKVTVVDDQLTASAPAYFLADGVTPADPVFRNSYDAADTDEVAIHVSKVLTNRPLKDQEFTFQAVDENGNVITAQNNAKGEVTFPLGKFTQVGTYRYTITEQKGNDYAIIYSDASFTVTVEVTDDGSGKLKAAVTYPEGGVKFDNFYKTPVQVELTAKKVLQGRQMGAGEFTFQVLNGDKVLQTAKNDGSGNVTFDSLVFDREGTYDLTVLEVPGDAIGVTYDDTEYNVQVVVTVGENGVLEASVQNADGLVFTNRYTDPTPAQVVLNGKKVLNGRAMANGEFTFQVLDSNGKVIASAKNDANGAIVFPSITFDREGDYTLTICEVEGDAIGVTYDDTRHTVKVSVTLTKENQLVGAVTYPEGGATFTNTFTKAEPVQVVLTGTKYLTGRTLENGEFSFRVTDAKGNVLATGTNDAAGKIVFGALSFSEAGTYQVKVSEIGGTLEGITYDGTVHTVTIQVELTKENELKATVSYPDTGLTFENSYDPHPNPGTGDSTKVGLLLVMLMLSGCGMIALLSNKRKFQA